MSFKLFVEPKEKILVNVAITFVQAAFAAWVGTGASVDKLALSAAAGAGASAVWNLVVKPNLVREGWLKG